MVNDKSSEKTSPLSGRKTKEALAASQKRRRVRRLKQLEIPEKSLTITGELLGKGGFGTVYVAHYNGKDAAAKVMEVDHGLGVSACHENPHDIREGKSEGVGCRAQGWAGRET